MEHPDNTYTDDEYEARQDRIDSNPTLSCQMADIEEALLIERARSPRTERARQHQSDRIRSLELQITEIECSA